MLFLFLIIAAILIAITGSFAPIIIAFVFAVIMAVLSMILGIK